MAEMKCCHQGLPVTCIRLLHDVTSVRLNAAVVLSYGKSWDLLDIVPELNQVYSHKAHRVHKGILWHPKVNRTCGVHGDVVGNGETLMAEL